MKQLLASKRKEAGLSQGAVAKKLGYTSPQFVSNWERGMSVPPVKTLKKLCGIYPISLADLKLAYTAELQKKHDQKLKQLERALK